jgi:uncharacterized protein YndB with AHSA1/START domain
MGLTIGLLNVRRSILIQAPPDRVWQEFEAFDRIVAWFGQGHELHQFEPKLGGQVDMSVAMEDDRRHYGGPVVLFEAQREISFESNWQPPHDWPVPTFFTLRLTPVYEATMVEIFHHGFERFGADAAEYLQGYEEGWDIKHLKSLRAIVEQ